MATIEQQHFLIALRAIMQEAYEGPESTDGTWFVDNEPRSGFIGLVEKLDAEEASRIIGYPGGASIASHANHLKFALNLVNRAARGENSYEGADWHGSWSVSTVTTKEWDALVKALEAEFEEVLKSLTPTQIWSDPLTITGSMAVAAHGAWHLGAIRQLIYQIKGF